MGDSLPAAGGPGLRRIRLRRRLAYVALACALLLVLLEGLIRVGAALFKGEVSLSAVLDRQREAAFPTIATRAGVQREVVHPYVGFVVDPTITPGFNAYGFLQIDGPILKRRPGLTIIGVTGGSVARDICQGSSAAIRKRLTEVLGPREIAIVCLAQEGFHQPQQAMTWSLFRSLGAEFDYLVNLDGFNEVALYASETRNDNSWYAYPRTWELRLSDTANPELNRLIGLGVTLKEQRKLWAARFHKLRRVPLLSLHLAWNTLDDAYAQRIAEITSNIQEQKTASEKNYPHTGPAVHFHSGEERIAALVNLWADASIHLSQMCAGAGTTYLHRLQPSLGFKTKRTLIGKEPRLIAEISFYRNAAELGYPLLVERGAQLRSNGIDFEDLSGLYVNIEEEIYADDCCHMTQLGNDLIATAIADGIVKAELENAPKP